MPKQKRIFRISGDNRGLVCPFKGIVCQQGDCHRCQRYVDWQKLRELILVCAWCSKVKCRVPNSGQPVVSHGICLECQKKHFPKTVGGER